MTDDETTAIVDICLTADGDCSSCAADLLERLVRRFPETTPAVQARLRAHDWLEEALPPTANHYLDYAS